MSVGVLITWPYKAGGRSRRGSPKAGTTVVGSIGICAVAVAYPELVSGGGVSKSRKSKWLVKVGASKVVNPTD